MIDIHKYNEHQDNAATFGTLVLGEAGATGVCACADCKEFEHYNSLLWNLVLARS